MGYTHLTADDPSVELFRGSFFKIRRALGTTALGINEVRMPAGRSGPEHDELETGHEEIYVILEGTGTATIDGTEVPLSAGQYLRVDASATRTITAGDDGMRFLALGGKPLPAYDGRASL